MEAELDPARFRLRHELLGRDEIDDKSLVGLRGVAKITRSVVNGTLAQPDGRPRQPSGLNSVGNQLSRSKVAS